MAMTAANSVLVPLQCEFFALEGLSQLIKTVDRVHKNLNPLLSIDGIILTMFDKRNKLSTQVAMDVKKHLQEKETGRTHQLRVHMMSLGHTILGDRFYGNVAEINLANELQLHAKDLMIIHPNE